MILEENVGFPFLFITGWWWCVDVCAAAPLEKKKDSRGWPIACPAWAGERRRAGWARPARRRWRPRAAPIPLPAEDKDNFYFGDDVQSGSVQNGTFSPGGLSPLCRWTLEPRREQSLARR